jgi:flavin-dependent dehydrogenase
MSDFDTIVVGARCAGAPVATLLARGGQKVLLLDADRLPSDQPLSTHYIHAVGVDWLDELGVGAQVRALSPPSRKIRLKMLSAAVELGYPRGRAGHCIRRSVLDALLQDAAVAAGAELRDRSEVVGLLRDGERVSGVEVEHDGKVERIRARVVVGADGRNSTIAQLTGAKEYLGYESPRFAYWGYWPVPRAWRDDAELRDVDAYIEFPQDSVVRLVFQTDGDLLLLAVAPEQSQLDAFRGNFDEAYLQALRGSPTIAKLVENNAREGKLLGIKKARFFLRQAAGPGFALVGDAGLHKDPTAGLGISDALRDSRNLAKAILGGGQAQPQSSGEDAMDAALRRYHLQRDVDAIDLYHFARDQGDPSYINPLNELVFARVAQRPDLLERMAQSADRVISPYAVIGTGTVVGWTLAAALSGRFGVVPAFFAAGKRGSALEKERKQRIELRDAG